MATNANQKPNILQPRRFSGQKKVNMRGRMEMVAPRTTVYKRTYGNASRNEVKKKIEFIRIFSSLLGNEY
jgi:hypothetical protein